MKTTSLVSKAITTLFQKVSHPNFTAAGRTDILSSEVIKTTIYAVKKHAKKADYASAIKTLRQQNLSVQEISKILDISESYIYKLLKK